MKTITRANWYIKTLEVGKRYHSNQIIDLIGMKSFKDKIALGELQEAGIADGGKIYLVK